MDFVEALTLGDVAIGIKKLAHELAKEESKKDSKRPYATQVKNLRRNEKTFYETFQRSFDQYHERMKHGMKLLANAGLLGRIEPEKVASCFRAMRNPESSCRIVQKELNISDEMMLSAYDHVAKIFDEKEFTSASDIFLVLTFLNPYVPSFWCGLGLAEEMKEDFDAASLAFLMAAEVQEEGYLWAIRAAECLKKAGKIEQAYRVLDTVIDETGNVPKLAALRQTAMNARKS